MIGSFDGIFSEYIVALRLTLHSALNKAILHHLSSQGPLLLPVDRPVRSCALHLGATEALSEALALGPALLRAPLRCGSGVRLGSVKGSELAFGGFGNLVFRRSDVLRNISLKIFQYSLRMGADIEIRCRGPIHRDIARTSRSAPFLRRTSTSLTDHPAGITDRTHFSHLCWDG